MSQFLLAGLGLDVVKENRLGDGVSGQTFLYDLGGYSLQFSHDLVCQLGLGVQKVLESQEARGLFLSISIFKFFEQKEVVSIESEDHFSLFVVPTVLVNVLYHF